MYSSLFLRNILVKTLNVKILNVNIVKKLQTNTQIYLDIVTTSGPETGVAADLEKIKQIRVILKDGKKLALASGVSGVH